MRNGGCRSPRIPRWRSLDGLHHWDDHPRRAPQVRRAPRPRRLWLGGPRRLAGCTSATFRLGSPSVRGVLGRGQLMLIGFTMSA
jgi:hypothetical protein